jgi:hypothetical protein
MTMKPGVGPLTAADLDDWFFRTAGAIIGMVQVVPHMEIDPMRQEVFRGCAGDLVELWRLRERLPGGSELTSSELVRGLSEKLALGEEGIWFDEAAPAIIDANLDDPEACGHRLVAHLTALREQESGAR